MNIKLSIPCFAALKPDASAREKILAAASELLLTEGFHALTQHAVAARAGVRQSHLTYYFPTRNDLLRATAQYGVETLLDPVAGPVAGTGSAPQDFRQLLMPDKSDRQWFRLMTGLLIASDEDQGIREWLREFDARIIEKLANGFARAGLTVGSEQLHFLHSTFVGALHLDMQEQTDESFAQLKRTVSMALDMILSSTPSPFKQSPEPIDPPVNLRKSAS